MRANTTNTKLIYPELSYLLVGICFDVHNTLGHYAREKQYADLLEQKLKEVRLSHKREFRIGQTGNIVDFLVDNKIVLELKAKQVIAKDDYYQLQRYLQHTGFPLGLLINFRGKYLRPKRVLKLSSPKFT